jgi:hypothetical protein
MGHSGFAIDLTASAALALHIPRRGTSITNFSTNSITN